MAHVHGQSIGKRPPVSSSPPPPVAGSAVSSSTTVNTANGRSVATSPALPCWPSGNSDDLTELLQFLQREDGNSDVRLTKEPLSRLLQGLQADSSTLNEQVVKLTSKVAAQDELIEEFMNDNTSQIDEEGGPSCAMAVRPPYDHGDSHPVLDVNSDDAKKSRSDENRIATILSGFVSLDTLMIDPHPLRLGCCKQLVSKDYPNNKYANTRVRSLRNSTITITSCISCRIKHPKRKEGEKVRTTLSRLTPAEAVARHQNLIMGFEKGLVKPAIDGEEDAETSQWNLTVGVLPIVEISKAEAGSSRKRQRTPSTQANEGMSSTQTSEDIPSGSQKMKRVSRRRK